MASGFQQGMRASQRQDMQLLPRMLQAVEILQLPAGELEAYLLGAFEENEALALDEVAWSQRARADGPPGRRLAAGREATERHDAWLESQPARGAGVVERALEQLAMRDVPTDLFPWVRLVISALDEHGYLTAGDESLLRLAEERGLAGGARELGCAIACVQSLEPRGIGGRNAVEGLLLQLDPRDPDYALLCLLLEDFLEDLARNKLPAVARALGIELPLLNSLLERLRALELRPATDLVAEAAPGIHPDVVVREDGAGFAVEIDASGLPPMRVDPGVRALARDRGLGPDVRKRLRAKLDQARWLLQAVEQRRETLQRVATAVFSHQEPFLRHGPERVRPLRMTEVARWLGIHASTVSRAVADKHADTPFGIFPLRWFFQAGAVGDDHVAREHVRELVWDVVSAEDKSAPLSDDAIVAELAARGHAVARRTVAKYRAELDLPSSYRRRRFD